MKTGLFLSTVGRQDGGPETYERQLATALPRVAPGNRYDIYCLNARARTLLEREAAPARVHQLRPSSRWISIPLTLPWSLWRDGLDLYHATFVPPPWAPVPLVFTMHDVSPFTHPEFYPPAILKRLTLLIRRGLEQARLIICISQHSMETTASHFDLPKERLAVAYHGVDERFQRVNPQQARRQVAETYGLHEPYLLYVGKLEARKNTLRLLEAFARYRRHTGSQARLVLAGRRFWDLQDIDATVTRLGLEEAVLEPGYVPDEDLPALYAAARMFVFPTLWEGFGFPVIEAMAAGTPVITSRTSCLPEIAGGSALLVDPLDVRDISDAMIRLDGDAELRKDLAARGRARAAQFTWEHCARQTLAAYQQALELPPRQ